VCPNDAALWLYATRKIIPPKITTQISQALLGKKATRQVNQMAALLQVKKPKKKQPTPQPRANRKMSVSSLGDRNLIGNYLAALTEPFSPNAQGARVPDQWSFPTVTYRSRGTMVFSSDSSGVASATFFCNPLISCINNDGATVTGGMSQYANSPVVWAAATQSSLSGVLASYRCVGGGISIRSNLPPTTATGRFIISHVPVASPGIGTSVLNSASIVVDAESACGFILGLDTGGTSNPWPADILELPDSQEFTVQDVISQSVECHFKPITPLAFGFCDAADNLRLNAAATYKAGASSFLVSGGTAATYDNPGEIDMRGWDAFLIRAEGLPVSTTAAFEVEYVYHYEGNPAMVTTAGALEPNTPPVACVNLPAFQSAISKGLTLPSFIQTTKDIGGSLLKGVKSAGALGLFAAKLGMAL
jgi:hypothetical protein